MMPLILLMLILAPAAAIIWYVYSKDRYEKEPKRLLILAFGYGILSIIPACIGYWVVGDWIYVSANPFMTALYAFGIVGFSEEFAKFIFLRYILFNKRDFNEPFDGIIYAVMIGMGFATFENVMYVTDGGIGVAIFRMFTAVPAHAVFGVVMGYWVGLAKFDPIRRNKYILRGLFMAVILHGAYDFFLMQKNIPALVLLSFIGLYVAIKKSRIALLTQAERSPFKDVENGTF